MNNNSAQQVSGYHMVHENDLKTALKYPMDYRRYKSTSTQISQRSYYDKQPYFFVTPEGAIDNAKIAITDFKDVFMNFKIVICSVLSSDSSCIETSMQWDYFPEYVVSLNQIEI